MVGRDREIAILNDLLEEALDGVGSFVLIGGEAGIGKTHLVNDLQARAARRGALVLTGHCYDGGGASPYGPWIEILATPRLARTVPTARSLFAEVLAAGPSQNQIALFSEVERLLQRVAESMPVVLVIEDLHWADAASLDLLRALTRRTEPLPALIVATYRDDELTPENPLYRLLPHLARDSGAERLMLHSLDGNAIGELVEQRYHLPPAAHAALVQYLDMRSQGNPFFISELLYALEEQQVLSRAAGGWYFDKSATVAQVEPVPLLVRQVIDSRLERLGPTVRRLLGVAAILGNDVEVDLWRELVDVDEPTFIDATRRALDAHFLREAPGGRRLQFRHALVCETLYASVVLPERRALHRRAAEVLVAQHAAPDAIAHHFVLAGAPEAVEWLTRAGERALEVYAPDSAIEHLTRTLEFAHDRAVAPPLRTRRLRGLAYATIGEFSKARIDLNHALEAAVRASDHLAEWQTLIDLGSLWSERDYSQTRAYYDEALSLAREIGDEATIAHSLSRVSNWFLNSNQPIEAIAHSEEALAIFRRLGDARGVAGTTRMLGMDYLVRGDLVACDRWFHDAIDQFETLDDRHGLCSAMTGLIYTAGTYTFHTEIPGPISTGELQEVSRKALHIARDTRWRAGEAYVQLALGSYHGIRGNYEQALASTEQGLAIATEIEHREWMALGWQILGRLHLDLGSLDIAEEHLRQSLTLAERAAAPLHSHLAMAYLAHVHIGRGEMDAALEALGPPLSLVKPPETVIGRKRWATRATLALHAGDPELALAITDTLLKTTLNASPGRVVPLYGGLRGRALDQLGRLDEAERQLREAIECARASGYRPVLWRLYSTLGKHFEARGRQKEANDWLAQAHALVQELADAIPDDDLRAIYLHDAATHVPQPRTLTSLQSAKLEYGGLTARQREVAALVARGYSNSEIAAALHISNRTAEGHVTAILTRLNFSSRAQIAAWAVDRGLVEL